ALRSRRGDGLVALRHRRVEVPARGRADVAGDRSRRPAQVVDRGDVGEEVEAVLVPERCRRLDDVRRLDHHRRLVVRPRHLDEPGDPVELRGAHEATLRISYAGGTPALTASCNRMIPSISCSGRGGQPGTYMSTGTILSTDCTIA